MPESYQLLLPGLLAGLPAATSSGSRRALPPPPPPVSSRLSARRVGAQPRRADLASDPAQHGESGSGVADPQPERGGERGRGEEGRGRSVDGRRAASSAASPPPSPPSPSRPHPIGPHSSAGSLEATTVFLAAAQPHPASALLRGSSHPNSRILPSVSILGDSCSTLLSLCPPTLSAAPRASTPYPGLGHEPHHSLAQTRAMAGGWAPGDCEKGGALCPARSKAG